MKYEFLSKPVGEHPFRFWIWSLKSHGIGSGQGPSPSELQRASNGLRRLSLIHIACLFMAKDQLQRSTPAQK